MGLLNKGLQLQNLISVVRILKHHFLCVANDSGERWRTSRSFFARLTGTDGTGAWNDMEIFHDVKQPVAITGLPSKKSGGGSQA